MNQHVNPWVQDAARPPTSLATAAPEHRLPLPSGVAGPLRGMIEPDAADRLARRTLTGTARLWITGVHGGAGETRLAELLDGARTTGHCWPAPDEPEDTPRVLLVCRSDLRGLTAAQNALIEWVSGASPAVDLLGLAIMADAPGKLPKPLRDFAALVGGGSPRVWMLPWVDPWRLGTTPDGVPGLAYQRFITDLAALTS